MSHCPYGTEAENRLYPMADSLPGRIRIQLHFILSGQGEMLSSLHGDEEMQEDERQAVIQKFWPDKISRYVQSVNKNLTDWKRALKECQINEPKLDSLILKEGKNLLQNSFLRTERLEIHSSPTLYINNQLYEDALEPGLIARKICEILPDNKILFCLQQPACLQDSDCKKPGKEGKCAEAGTAGSRCDYRRAEPFEMTVITDSTLVFSTNIHEIVKSAQDLLPGAKVKQMDIANPLAQVFLRKNDIQTVPAVFLGAGVEKSEHFDKISNMVESGENGFFIQKQIFKNYSFWREKQKSGEMTVFWSPLSSQANEILDRFFNMAAAMQKNLSFIRWNPIVLLDEEGRPAARSGKMELEEIQRQMALPPDLLLPYLSLRIKNWDTSYWEESLETLNLNPQEIKKNALGKSVQAEAVKAAERFKSLGSAEGNIFFLVENKQLIKVQNEEDLAKLLELER
jgi:hypothetical protein